MDLNALSAWANVASALGQIGGSIAVVVSLLLLVRQLRLNTQAIRVASYQGDVTNTISLTGAVFMNPEFAEFFSKAQKDPASLNRTEQVRWHCFMLSIFRHYEGLLLQHREGAIDSDLWRGYDAALLNWLRSPGWADWFDRNATSFSTGLQNIVGAHIRRVRGEGAEAVVRKDGELPLGNEAHGTAA